MKPLTIANYCPKCKRVFFTPEDEVGEYRCPRCGYFPQEVQFEKEVQQATEDLRNCAEDIMKVYKTLDDEAVSIILDDLAFDFQEKSQKKEVTHNGGKAEEINATKLQGVTRFLSFLPRPGN